jgi:hypothetical protein
MRIAKHLLIVVLLFGLVVPAAGASGPPEGGPHIEGGPHENQPQPDVWKTFASRIDVGVQLNVRLRDGQRFRATLIDARDDVLLLQPRTRVPVPVQPVAYDAIVSLEQVKGGMNAGKAAAIGVASGVGAFFATMLIIIAAVAD